MFEELDYQSLISRTFTELYGSSPAIVVRAPGRINLIGEHTDYNNGFVFPAAINREIIFAMSPSTRPDTSLFALNINKGALVNHKKLVPKSNPAWTNFFTGVVAGLQRRGIDIPPVNCVFGGDIPNGAGLSSSAALEVGFGTALTQLFELFVEPWDIIQIAQKAEHEYVGVKCGIMDMFASKMGKKDHAMLLDCRDLTFDYYPL
ncbi:MAG: galactokinase family protein, partial [Imperialibacter sp.]